MNRAGFKMLFMVGSIFCVTTLSCSSNSDVSEQNSFKNESVVAIDKILTIGLEVQGTDYQLGKPIGVRTDKKNNIYIADRASLTIRKYNEEGEFIKEIGNRGRGPGEFLDINTFEVTPEGNFFILDRGNMRYTIINLQGEELSAVPIHFSKEWQFYPDGIGYYDDKILTLFNSGSFSPDKPVLEKDLFHIYDKELKTKSSSFFSFLEFQNIEMNSFAWLAFLGKPGSFTFTSDKEHFFYSPLIYHGNIYYFTKIDTSWRLEKVIKSHDFLEAGFVNLSASEYDKYESQEVPGLRYSFYGGDEPHIGRVNVFDAGIHKLSDDRIIVFTAKWRNSLEKRGRHENLIDIYAQIIKKDLSTEFIGLMMSVEATKMPWKPLINWKDENDNFYLLDNTDINFPTVTKFSIDLKNKTP